jgi:hypothetical protein
MEQKARKGAWGRCEPIKGILNVSVRFYQKEGHNQNGVDLVNGIIDELNWMMAADVESGKAGLEIVTPSIFRRLSPEWQAMYQKWRAENAPPDVSIPKPTLRTLH